LPVLLYVLWLAGVVTGIGLVHGQEVLFVANDATVKGNEKHLKHLFQVIQSALFIP